MGAAMAVGGTQVATQVAAQVEKLEEVAPGWWRVWSSAEKACSSHSDPRIHR